MAPQSSMPLPYCGPRGWESEEFKQVDAEAGRLWTKLRELQGTAGKHWMA